MRNIRSTVLGVFESHQSEIKSCQSDGDEFEYDEDDIGTTVFYLLCVGRIRSGKSPDSLRVETWNVKMKEISYCDKMRPVSVVSGLGDRIVCSPLNIMLVGPVQRAGSWFVNRVRFGLIRVQDPGPISPARVQ
jgi:hypothetical protein